MKKIFWVYRNIFSPFLHAFSKIMTSNPYAGCKFEPTCSCYCEQSIEKYGLIQGGAKAAHRLLRCHPFSRSGGYDPV